MPPANMKPLRNLFFRTSKIPPKVVTPGWLVLSLLGFVDAAYLTIQHYRGGDQTCGPLWDCASVANSPYAEIGGISTALFGVLYYLLVFLLSVAYVDTKQIRLLSFIVPLTGIGFLISLILVCLQVFVIHALCLYCMISAVASIGLFALSVVYIRASR